MTFAQTQANTWSQIVEDWRTGKLGTHDTPSGPGSSHEVTADLREWLPELFSEYNIRTVLDAPCGDFSWMKLVPLLGIDYQGWDVVPELIDANNMLFGERFAVKNLLTAKKIPDVDLIICRDFMIHLRNDDISKLLAKFIKSGARYLLASTHPDAVNRDGDDDMYPAYWQREVNLQAEPFNLAGLVDIRREPQHPVGCSIALFDLHANA